MSELKLSNITEPASPATVGQVTVYVSGSAATPNIPELYYKDEFGTVTGPLGSGGGTGVVTGTFNEPLPAEFVTTASVSIAGGQGFTYTAGSIGLDTYFFVSGVMGGKDGTQAGVSVFGGDVAISGTLHGGSPLKIGSNTQITGSIDANLGLSGSLTRLHTGESYLIAGSGIDIVSESNGSVTISSTGTAQSEWIKVVLGNDDTGVGVSGNPRYYGSMLHVSGAGTAAAPTNTQNPWTHLMDVTGSVRKVTIMTSLLGGTSGGNHEVNFELNKIDSGGTVTTKTIVSNHKPGDTSGTGYAVNQKSYVLTSSLDFDPGEALYIKANVPSLNTSIFRGVYTLLIEVSGTIWP